MLFHVHALVPANLWHPKFQSSSQYFALSFLSSTQKCKIPTDNTVTWFQLASCYTRSFYLEFEQYMNITYAGILDNQ